MRKLIIAGLFAAFATPALAHTISLEMDQSTPMRLRSNATGVVVGNAGVADVIVHDPKVLIIMGKSIGTTHILVLGENGRTLYSGDVTVRAGKRPNMLTVQRGREIQNSLCQDRCIDVVSAESTSIPMGDALGRIRSRSSMTSGH